MSKSATAAKSEASAVSALTDTVTVVGSPRAAVSSAVTVTSVPVPATSSATEPGATVRVTAAVSSSVTVTARSAVSPS